MTDKAFRRLGSGVSKFGGEKEERTKHLQSLPDGLFIENAVEGIRVIAVFDTLHVLWRSEHVASEK